FCNKRSIAGCRWAITLFGKPARCSRNSGNPLELQPVFAKLGNAPGVHGPDPASRMPAIAYVDGFEDFFTSPFFTPASRKIHMAITMHPPVAMTKVENSGRIGERAQ